MPDFAGGPATFLFSDIEGSTRLLTSLGDAYGAVFDEHQRLLRASFAAHSGVVISTEGDSFFVVFKAAFDAIAAAADTQRALAEHGWPVDHVVRVRIGIHSGRAVKTAGDYVGIDINRTARIAAAGHGGQVLVSEPTAIATAGSLPEGVELEDLGRHRLKDVGVEHLWQLRIDGLPGGFGPLRSLETHPTNLPAEARTLVDRDRECEEIGALVQAARIVTVTGLGGVGKSIVAIHVAREAIDSFPDGVFYLDLMANEDAETTVLAMVAVLGAPSGAMPTIEHVVDHIRSRHLLLVLDTADRVRDLGGALSTIASRCPNVRLLITSRSAVRLTAEHEYPIGPLSLERDDRASGRSPAAELFIDRGRAVRPDLRVDDETLASVEAICARLEGLPLAIELAAARVRVLTPTAILGRLTHALPLLAGGPADAPSRQRTLRDTIDWSVGLLDPGERSALERLAVFVSGFDLDAAEAVAELGGDTLESIERLVGLNFLSVVEDATEPRFRFHRLVREYAIEALDATEDGPAVRRRYVRYWTDVARARVEAIGGDDEPTALADLRRDGDEFRAALDWLADRASDDPELVDLGISLAGALGGYWWLTSQSREGSTRLDRALEAGTGSDPARHAQALYWAGVLDDEIGRPESALRRLQDALSIQETLGDEIAVARTLNSLGVVARSTGDLDRAERLLEDSLARKRANAGQRGLSTSLHNLAIVAADRGDYDRAVALLEEAIRIDDEGGPGGAQTFSRLTISAVRIWSGDDERGVGELRLVLPRLLELDAEDALADGLEALATAAMRAADMPRAARLLFAADGIRVRVAVPLRPIERDRLRQIRIAIDSALRPAEIEAARADVAAMDLASIVDYAIADQDESVVGTA